MEFHNRATGMIHSVIHGPDGSMVNGVHKTLGEAHEWAKQGLKPMANPKDIKQADRYVHKTDDGKLLGAATVRNYGVDYTPAVRD